LRNNKPVINLDGLGDEQTPKAIRSDKGQNISINIYGDKTNDTKVATLVDVEKLTITSLKRCKNKSFIRRRV